eukprot:Polyplicarium_translucidae@DN1206_c0_g1_i2.p1
MSTLAMQQMAEKLSRVLSDKEALIRSAKASFRQFDKDRSGSLDFEECKELIERLCQNLDIPPVDDQTLRAIMSRYDSTGDGVLTLEEFARMYYDMLLRVRDKYYPTKTLRVRRAFFVGRMNLSESNRKIRDLFKFEKHLGAGSFGDVHLVEEMSSSQKRVCKTINKDKACLPVEQIEAEISFMKTLDHPNIIKIFEVYEDFNNIYIIMETCEGGELLQRVTSAQRVGRHLSERSVAGIMQQVMEAIAYIHEKKIAHKDLKPENIMFQDASPNSPLKVIDFGVAEMFEDPSGRSRNAAGTALYMAPEVFHRAFGLKCDIWSAGCILYLLVTGHLPFIANSMGELQRKIRAQPPNYAKEASHLSSKCLELLRAMLSVNPKARPSAKQVLQHPWFKLAPEISAELSNEICSNMQRYMKQGELKKALVNVITHQLNVTGSQIRNIVNIFRGLDVDSSGTLTHEELTRGLEAAGWKSWDINRVVSALDVDQSGHINYTEFVAACYTWQDSELNVIWTAFQKLDADGDGKIATHEFAKLLLGDDYRVATRDELEAMLAEVDRNNDGVVEWDEFLQYMKSCK